MWFKPSPPSHPSRTRCRVLNLDERPTSKLQVTSNVHWHLVVVLPVAPPSPRWYSATRQCSVLVLHCESQLYQWRIVHSAGSVYSTKCTEIWSTPLYMHWMSRSVELAALQNGTAVEGSPSGCNEVHSCCMARSWSQWYLFEGKGSSWISGKGSLVFLHMFQLQLTFRIFRIMVVCHGWTLPKMLLTGSTLDRMLSLAWFRCSSRRQNVFWKAKHWGLRERPLSESFAVLHIYYLSSHSHQFFPTPLLFFLALLWVSSPSEYSGPSSSWMSTPTLLHCKCRIVIHPRKPPGLFSRWHWRTPGGTKQEGWVRQW